MIEIRQASAQDNHHLLPLLMDMQAHYRDGCEDNEALARERLEALMRRNPPDVLLLAIAERPLGFSTLYEMFPGMALRPAWFMKELYVAGDARGRGIGARLLVEAGRIARQRGGCRLEFTTESDSPARAFYERMGARLWPKVVYRFEGEGLETLAGGADEAGR